jgi:hypothetical protein
VAEPVKDPSHRQFLSTLATKFTTRAETIYKAAGGRKEGTESFRRTRERAGDHNVGLYGYWSSVRERSTDSYIYEHGGKKSEVDEIFRPLKDVDRTLKDQLGEWAKVTSPYDRDYDGAEIARVGQDENRVNG